MALDSGDADFEVSGGVDRRTFVLSALWSTSSLHAEKVVWNKSNDKVYKPSAFGAKGVGISFDDSPAIQAAIDAASDAGGGRVLFSSPPKFYNIRNTLICRPRVSLIGDGTMPRLVSLKPEVPLLLPGNFHPDFIGRALYDPLHRFSAGTRVVQLKSRTAIGRYNPGDQVYVCSRAKGQTGEFEIPRYGWLNIILENTEGRLRLREEIDVAVDAEITLLADTIGRNAIPLFFCSDSLISGLSLEAGGSLMSDSAMLRVDFIGNISRAKRAIYGNTFQHVRWINNDFLFYREIGEMSLNSLASLVHNNRFKYIGATDSQLGAFSGFYIHEFARRVQINKCVVSLGSKRSENFLISITNAQHVIVEDLSFSGAGSNSLIYMGHPGTPDFAITGNAIRKCAFSIAETDRFVLVRGYGSEWMHDNIIEKCVFLGDVRAHDALRFEDITQSFFFLKNRWLRGKCFSYHNSRSLVTNGNINSHGFVECRDLGSAAELGPVQ